jgi:Protein of unknown function (DUF4242)
LAAPRRPAGDRRAAPEPGPPGGNGPVRTVATFLVFRELPGVTRDQYAAAQQAAAAAARGASREVRYMGGFFLPGQARAVCIFDAGSATDVAEVNERAGVPFTDVLAAIDLRLGG